MQPGDQAVTAFVVAVFVFFSVVMAYASWVGAPEKKDGDISDDKQ